MTTNAPSLPRFSHYWRSLDHSLLITIISLMVIGICLSWLVSPFVADRYDARSDYYFLVRHVAFASVGLLVLVVTSAMSITGVRRFAGLALAGSLVLMLALPFIGHEVNGAVRWLRLPMFSLQPSEFLKPAFVVMAAWLISEENSGAPVPGRIIVLGLYALAVLLLMTQPDFGQTVLLTFLLAALLFIARMSVMMTVSLAAIAGVLGAAAYFTLGHVRARIHSFISPSSEGGWTQTDAAQTAIANGGIMGMGPGEGTGKRLLPEAHTDYVYSVAVEDLGLLATIIIVGFFAALFFYAWSRAMKMQSHFAQLATAGLALLFGFQALINVGVNLDILPSTGMTLPFISYGGSSMLALAFAAGMLLALTRRRPGTYLHSS